MKKLISLFLLSFTGYNALSQDGEPPVWQNFPTTQRAFLFERGVYTCQPCYSWTIPTFQHFKAAYGSKLITVKAEQSNFVPIELVTSLNGWFAQEYMNTPFNFTWGSPTLWLNQDFRYHNSDDSVYRQQMHNSIDSCLALPALAAPQFLTDKIGTDSLVVYTQTKFLQNAPAADYRVTVLLLQDSIYYMQTGAPTGWMYHMNVLRGPHMQLNIPNGGGWLYNSNDSLSYTLANGTVAAGTVIQKTFRFKLDTGQHINHIRPLVLITRYDPMAQTYDHGIPGYVTMPRHIYINATEQEYDSTATTPVAATTPESFEAYVYPNPVINNKVFVRLKHLNGPVEIVMFDALGRAVLRQQVTDGAALPVHELPPSVYMYLLTTDGKLLTKGSLVVTR